MSTILPGCFRNIENLEIPTSFAKDSSAITDAIYSDLFTDSWNKLIVLQINLHYKLNV